MNRADDLAAAGIASNAEGRSRPLRLHPISVREACDQQGTTPGDALTRLLERGGFPDPWLADSADAAQRWRRQYATDLVREDVLEFSRLREVNTMRIFFELLRERVGAPASLASMARDLAVSPVTLKRYLDVLQALFIVFVVQPWHLNIVRALLQAPKVYFYDTGLVTAGDGLRFENAVAGMLLKNVHWQQDVQGRDAGLHYLRTKDGAEVDFCLSSGGQLTQPVECKLAEARPHRALVRFAAQFPQAGSTSCVPPSGWRGWRSSPAGQRRHAVRRCRLARGQGERRTDRLGLAQQ